MKLGKRGVGARTLIIVVAVIVIIITIIIITVIVIINTSMPKLHTGSLQLMGFPRNSFNPRVLAPLFSSIGLLKRSSHSFPSSLKPFECHCGIFKTHTIHLCRLFVDFLHTGRTRYFFRDGHKPPVWMRKRIFD